MRSRLIRSNWGAKNCGQFSCQSALVGSPNGWVLGFRDYGTCSDAIKALPSSSQVNLSLWYRQPQLQNALVYLEKSETEIDTAAYACLLRRCSKAKALSEGKLVHDHIRRNGLQNDLYLGNHLIEMYRQCESLEIARLVFEGISNRDVISWTTMIAAYAQNGHCKEVICLLQQMYSEGVNPDRVTFVTLSESCTEPEALANGKVIHACVIKSSLELNVVLETAIVNMYGKCGNAEEARRIFCRMHQRDEVSWNTMIGIYAECGDPKGGLELVRLMPSEGILPNKITFLGILDSCISINQGKVIHASILRAAYERDVIMATSLVHMYGENGNLDDAEKIFCNMLHRNVVSWTAMIAVYAQHGFGKDSLQLLEKMQLQGIKPNEITFITVLDACSNLAGLEIGKFIHKLILEKGFHSDIVLQNALLHMYSKCGSLEDARSVFKLFHSKTVISWNAMIAAYSQHGFGMEALQHFQQMQQQNTRPDKVTFVSVLSACSCNGLVDEGFEFFLSMTRNYGIEPTAEHYGCMIDLLGRAGHLREAEVFIKTMPFQPDVVAWKTLLGACRIYGDMERGKHAAQQLHKLDPDCTVAYVNFANICAT